MNMQDLLDMLATGGVVINNLNVTINNNNAETIVNGDGATVNHITVQHQRERLPLIAGGVDYRYSHCAPLAEELTGGVMFGWGDTRDKETDYYNRVYRNGQ